MGVNRNKEHLVVFTEDSAYNSLMIGFEKSIKVNSNLVDTRKPFGGSYKVFNGLEENLHLLERYPKCHILLLMDFDDKEQNLDPLYGFNGKMDKFRKITTKEQRERVFLLGVNNKEAEALKSFFKCRLEEIGESLVADCPDDNLDKWRNIHLECNLAEIQRFKEASIFSWLFS